jgi:hypothetical protein
MTRLPFAAIIGALLIAPALPASADCPTNQFFTQPASFTSGLSPFHVTTADFNSDGILDLAVTDNGGSDIGIMLGVGDGAFRNAVTYPVNPGNGHLIAADLDRDGILDIATNSSGTDVISVLKGRGDGTFASAVTYPAGYAPYGIASADFNGDGIPDLAAADFLWNNVSIMLGLAGGGYAAPVAFSCGNHPYDLETGDFNHDGVADLVVTNQDGGDVSVLLGHGDATFAGAVHYPVEVYPYSVVVADFNHDGIQDLAVANGGSGSVSILLGHGSGGIGDGMFAAATSLPTGGQPRNVTVGDFDRDGITDLAVADYYGSVVILFGQGSGGAGNGSFSVPSVFPAGMNPTGIAVGDFNADTSLDLAVANYLTHGVSVLLHGCGAPPPPPPGPAPTLTAVRDVPNDQGGRLFLTWLRSGLDALPYPQITGYRVWRRIPPTIGQVRLGRSSLGLREVETRLVPGPDGMTVTYWEALVTLPAERLEGYGYTAPTTQDSMAGSNPYTAFFITALTADPTVFYESNVDSGYSVDNIPPAQPGGFSAAFAHDVVSLRWAANREPDLDVYHVYRGSTPDFQPGLGNLMTAAVDTAIVDPQGNLSCYYKITAVDQHGNEGPSARATPVVTTQVIADPSVAFALHGATPNPSHTGAFTISFTLPSSAPARLTLFDLAGRRIWDQAVGEQAAGLRTFEVGGGRSLPTGVYLVQLTQAGRSAAVRVVVSR